MQVVSQTDQIDAAVFFNHRLNRQRQQLLDRVPRSHRALVMWEPRVTDPCMYRANSLRNYGYRFAPSPRWARAVGACEFKWPQNLVPYEAQGSEYWRYSATMINGNKRSAIRGSLYGLRRRVISTSMSAGVPVAVFGRGWGSGLFEDVSLGVRAVGKALHCLSSVDFVEALGGSGSRPQFQMGEIEHKSVALKQAPMSIVIENSADYVSEKLFDAIRHGVVPIYVGPPLQEFGIPQSVALETPPVAAEIIRVIRASSVDQSLDVIAAGRDWICSEEVREHGSDLALEGLGRSIAAQLA